MSLWMYYDSFNYTNYTNYTWTTLEPSRTSLVSLPMYLALGVLRCTSLSLSPLPSFPFALGLGLLNST